MKHISEIPCRVKMFCIKFSQNMSEDMKYIFMSLVKLENKV
jgi:hypothetical protein